MISNAALNNIQPKIIPIVKSAKDPIEKTGNYTELPFKQTLGGPLKPQAKWLFFNYMAGDNNLDYFELKNIDQMERVGSDKDTHIVAYIDIGPNPNPLENTWSGCRAFYITKDDTPDKINSEVITDFGNDIDMSSPKTLTAFGIDALRKFPARYKAVIFNDHGGGPTGALEDKTNGDFMTLPQFRQGLSQINKTTGKKFDIIGFDACLMQCMETAYELKDCGEYLLGSEENEGGDGWQYAEMLSGRTLNEAVTIMRSASNWAGINMEPKEFAKLIVGINEKHQDVIQTFSCVDLTKINQFTTLMKDFAEAITLTKDKNGVRSAVSRAESYGHGRTPYKDLHDLHHLCSLLQETSSDQGVKNTALKILDAINSKEIVIKNENDPGSHPNSRGISVYFPLSYTGDLGYGYNNLAFVKATGWDQAIKNIAVNSGGFPEGTPRMWPDNTPRKPKQTSRNNMA